MVGRRGAVDTPTRRSVDGRHGRHIRWRLGDERQQNGKAQSRVAAFGAARDRWVLLREQQRRRGLERWRKARGSRWWTQSLEDCVRWILGRGCSQQEDGWAASVVWDLGSAGSPPTSVDGVARTPAIYAI
jgi:hypothetical protein